MTDQRERPRDIDADDRRWRLLMGLSYGALAAVGLALAIIAAAVVVAVLLLHAVSPGADTAKARSEVQQYYDHRARGHVEVRGCAFAPVGDSDFETFSCTVQVACRRRVILAVPWAASSFRSDLPARPREPALPLRCGAD